MTFVLAKKVNFYFRLGGTGAVIDQDMLASYCSPIHPRLLWQGRFKPFHRPGYFLLRLVVCIVETCMLFAGERGYWSFLKKKLLFCFLCHKQLTIAGLSCVRIGPAYVWVDFVQVWAEFKSFLAGVFDKSSCQLKPAGSGFEPTFSQRYISYICQ